MSEKKGIENRQFPRFKFKEGMWLKVVKKADENSKFKMYRLLDISQGGISFICNDRNEFKHDDALFILEIEGKTLDHVIYAEVRYIAPLDEHLIDFKVGVEFITKVQGKK
jgi:c-di-GMP-binding flagellar brake protein YcgR